MTVRPPRPARGPAELRDAAGRLLRQWPAAPAAGAERELALGGLASSLYLLTVQDADGLRYCARLLRQ